MVLLSLEGADCRGNGVQGLRLFSHFGYIHLFSFLFFFGFDLAFLRPLALSVSDLTSGRRGRRSWNVRAEFGSWVGSSRNRTLIHLLVLLHHWGHHLQHGLRLESATVGIPGTLFFGSCGLLLSLFVGVAMDLLTLVSLHAPDQFIQALGFEETPHGPFGKRWRVTGGLHLDSFKRDFQAATTTPEKAAAYILRHFTCSLGAKVYNLIKRDHFFLTTDQKASVKNLAIRE